MNAREFRCGECGYPFKTAEQGWARDAALMCPACGSSDVTILVSPPRRRGAWTAVAKQPADTERLPVSGWLG